MQELVLAAKLAEARVLYASAEDGTAAPYETLARALKPALNAAAEAAPGGVRCPLPGHRGDARPGGGGRGRLAVPGLRRSGRWCWCWTTCTGRMPRSIEVFNHCARHLGQQRVLCLGAHRNDETAPDSPVWYTLEDGSASAVNLAPLTPEAQLALVQAMLPGASLESGFADALYRATGGNAFFLGEVLRSLMEDGALVRRDGGWLFPSDPGALAALGSIEATVARRLGQLAEPARELGGVAAVLGRSQPLPLLLGLAGLEEDDLFEHLDQLLERQVLEKGEGGYAFPHDRACARSATPGWIRPPGGPAPARRRAAGGRRRRRRLRAGLALLAFGRPCPGLPLPARRGRRGARGGVAGRRHRPVGTRGRGPGPVQRGADRQALWWLIGATGSEIRPDLARTALERLIAELAPTDPRVVEARAFLAVAHGFAGTPLQGLQAAQEALAQVPPDQPLRQAAALMVQGPALFAAGHVDALLDVAARARAVLAPVDPTGHGPFVLSTRVGAISYALAVCHQGQRAPADALEQALEAAEDAGAFDLFLTIRHYPALAAARGEQAR